MSPLGMDICLQGDSQLTFGLYQSSSRETSEQKANDTNVKQGRRAGRRCLFGAVWVKDNYQYGVSELVEAEERWFIRPKEVTETAVVGRSLVSSQAGGWLGVGSRTSEKIEQFSIMLGRQKGYGLHVGRQFHDVIFFQIRTQNDYVVSSRPFMFSKCA